MTTRFLRPALVFVHLSAFAPRVPGVPPELTRYTPADALVSVLTDGTAAREGQAASPNVVLLLAARVKDMGLIPDGAGAAGLFVDLAAALPIVTRRPWAVTLLDVAATPASADGRHLADFRGALVMLTRGDHQEIERQIRRALSTYTNSDLSQLSERRIGTATVYELSDSRLPEWSRLSWGAVGDAYVVAVGQGTIERIIAAGAAESQPAAEWLARARRACHSTEAAVEWTVDFAGLRRQLVSLGPEVFDRALDAFDLAKTDRALWTIGAVAGGMRLMPASSGGQPASQARTAREITCYAYARAAGEDKLSIIAGPDIRNPLAKDLIPPEASAYAVFDHQPAVLIRRLAAGYLATCNDEWRAKLRRNWGRLQDEAGANFQRDVLDQLGEHIVVHTWPPHPLGIPVLCTVELEIAGSADKVRSALNVLLERYRDYLDEGRSAHDPFALSLHHDPDGIWYMQAGLYGPALAITDRWIVISFAPQAVRQNAEYLSRLANGQGTTAQPAPR